jgi:hypothetical protein
VQFAEHAQPVGEHPLEERHHPSDLPGLARTTETPGPAARSRAMRSARSRKAGGGCGTLPATTGPGGPEQVDLDAWSPT